MAQPAQVNDDATRHQPDDAIALLTADHRRIRRLFQHYEDTADHALRGRIAADVRTVLERHLVREDTVLYAAFAVATDEAGEMLLGEAFRAHELCTILLEALEACAPDDATFVRHWHALRAQIETHMDEEEREFFPQAARLLAADMGEITAAMQAIPAPRLVAAGRTVSGLWGTAEGLQGRRALPGG
jgi:hemerythrin-like domain-containing protein